MSNSSLVTYTNITKTQKTSPRTHTIDTITIHCVVGQWTAKQICDYFANTNRNASCNYAVGKDGSIGLCVDEADRSWCSSNSANDNRAITIETASDTSSPYAVTDAAYNALIKLAADICRRNGIKKLVWSEDKNTRINHTNGANMTVHRDFANKACPGDYLYNRHGDIADKVNALLGAATTRTTTIEKAKSFDKSLAGSYKVTASALNVRAGAGEDKVKLVTIPGGTTVRNYGYYTVAGGTKWLYVTASCGGKSYVGFCCAKYLTK